MDILLSHEIVDTTVTILDTTIYASPEFRNNYVGATFFNLKKSTGDVHITVPFTDLTADAKWIFTDLVHGHYKFELVLVPIFVKLVSQYVPAFITKGTIVYHVGIYYIALFDILSPYTTPDIDYTNWEIINVFAPEDVINKVEIPNAGESTFYVSVEFLYFNNLAFTYSEDALVIPKDGNICCSPNITDLRCLRDKLEAVEIAAASNEFYKGEIILESVSNPNCSCSC